jgi:hypothetical protein
MLRALALVTSLFLVSACAEPPSKEMHQAQGAIDAAKAAGAEQYAPEELKGAVNALAQADVAVSAKDYRLALSNALDSRERAQNAAKAAVDARARARGDAERALAEATAAVDRVEARLKASDVPKLPRRTVASVESQVSTARQTLQEARTTLESESYGQVGRTAASIATQMKAAIESLGGPAAAATRGRKR